MQLRLFLLYNKGRKHKDHHECYTKRCDNEMCHSSVTHIQSCIQLLTAIFSPPPSLFPLLSRQNMALRSFYQKTIVRTAFFFTVLFFCSYLIPNNLTLRSSSSRYPISFKDDPIRWSNASQSRQPNPHFTAAYVTLTKSDAESLGNLRKTIRNLEDTVNRERGYPYIIFCSEPLSQDSRDLVRALTRADVEFYDLDSTMYGYSDNIDLDKAAETRRRMSDVIFGDDENYRFASRFMAGVIFR